MNYEKIDKLISLVLVLAVIATLGFTINRQNAPHSVEVVSVEKAERIRVSVTGEVAKPGTYSVSKGARICDVLYSAGGVTMNADTEVMNLNALVMEDTNIDVPCIKEDSIPDSIPVVNINTADEAELMLIPGIGEVTANRIIDYRNSHGSFSQISDIKNVRGIGDKKFEEIKDYIITPEINNTEG